MPIQTTFRLTLYVCVLMFAVTAEDADAQIRRVEKLQRIGRHGEIAKSRDAVGYFVTYEVKCILDYRGRGPDRQFVGGRVSLYRRNQIFPTDLDLLTFEGFRDQNDVLKFIKLLDELYSTPLDGDEQLKLDLSSSDPRDAIRFGGKSLELGKTPKGYYIFSPGIESPYEPGIFIDRGWKKINLIAFRETLDRTAAAANLEVPNPPPEMQAELNDVHNKVWELGKRPPKGSEMPPKPPEVSKTVNWCRNRRGDSQRTYGGSECDCLLTRREATCVRQ